MENKNDKNKFTLKNITLLMIFGVLIIGFKYYITKGDFCKDSCTNINSELDIIKCLDACSINAEDYREPISNTKIIIYVSILIIFFAFLIRFINNINRGNINLNNLANRFIQWIKKLKNKLSKKDKSDNDGYKKLE